MNGRTSKLIRRMAEQKAIEWYLSLLEESEAAELSPKQVLGNIVKVEWHSESAGSTRDVTAGVIKVTENTLRYYYKQEKKQYGLH